MHALNEHLPLQSLKTAVHNFQSAVRDWRQS
jgi:hypothetical protein